MLRAPHRSAIALSIAGLLSMLACGGSSPSPALSAPNDVVDFGEVDVGGSVARAVTVTNTTTSPLDVTDVITSGAGVITSGRALPFRLQPGESTRLFVEMAPTTSGDLSGTVSLQSATTADPVTLIRTNGRVRLADQLAASPATVAFGEVAVGARVSQDVTLTNRGTQDVTVTSLSASTAGVSFTGLALPATFAPGQSATFTLAFAPAVAGGVSGSIAARAATGRPASVVAVSGTGVSPAAPVTLAASPARVDFGDVTVQSFSTQGVTLTNSSAQQVTISEVGTTGTGFTATGIAPATVLAPGASATVSVKYTPAAVGAAAGQVAVRTAGQTEPLAVVDLVGNGVAAASITSVSVRDATAQTSGTVQMVADVVAVGTIDKSVTWTLDSASLGTIDPKTGVYTAPSTAGTYRVWATSNADPSKKDAGNVTVTAVPTPPPTPTPTGTNDLTSCTQLVSSISATYPITYPSMPGYLGSFYEPDIKIGTQGVKITRISGTPGTAVGSLGVTWDTWAGPAYPVVPAWNSDESLLVLDKGVAGQQLFLDGTTYAPLYVRSRPGGAASGGTVQRWHPSPTYAKIMIYVVSKSSGGCGVGYWNPTNGSATDPTGTSLAANSSHEIWSNSSVGNCDFGGFEGNASWDGRYIPLNGTLSGSDVAWVLDLTAKAPATPYLTASQMGLTSSIGGAKMGPTGRYWEVSGQNWNTGDWLGLNASPATTTRNIGYYQHKDACLEYQTSNDVLFGSKDGGAITMSRLQDGSEVSIAGAPVDQHAGCRNIGMPGWGFMTVNDTSSSVVYKGEVIAARLSSGQVIRRLFHHRSSGKDGSGNGADAWTAHATASYSGKRVVFASDWGSPGGTRYAFVADLSSVCP